MGLGAPEDCVTIPWKTWANVCSPDMGPRTKVLTALKSNLMNQWVYWNPYRNTGKELLTGTEIAQSLLANWQLTKARILIQFADRWLNWSLLVQICLFIWRSLNKPFEFIYSNYIYIYIYGEISPTECDVFPEAIEMIVTEFKELRCVLNIHTPPTA